MKMDIKGPYTDNNGTIWKKGRYWLIALHISSKDTPNWVWATFEHVANPGRCDFTGCNDSYGYSSADSDIGAGQAKNYTASHVKCNDLPLPSFVFDNGNNYGSGPSASSLASVFQDLGIGAKDNNTVCRAMRTKRGQLSAERKSSSVCGLDGTAYSPGEFHH